jgi:hypothetical protein
MVFDRNAYQKTYWQTHPEQYEAQKQRVREWQKAHPTEVRAYQATLKFDALLHYTQVFDPTATMPHCHDIFHLHPPNDPFYTDVDCLTIDHPNNDGAKERKAVGSGTSFYVWLKKHNYPEGYQVLCNNCQLKKEVQRRRNVYKGQNTC